MTPQEQHDLEKLLADVANVEVHEVPRSFFELEPNQHCMVWHDEAGDVWEPFVDANQMELVYEQLRESGHEYTIGYTQRAGYHWVELRTPEDVCCWQSDPKKSVAIALAVKEMRRRDG